jgi:hypothetical protein
MRQLAYKEEEEESGHAKIRQIGLQKTNKIK